MKEDVIKDETHTKKGMPPANYAGTGPPVFPSDSVTNHKDMGRCKRQTIKAESQKQHVLVCLTYHAVYMHQGGLPAGLLLPKSVGYCIITGGVRCKTWILDKDKVGAGLATAQFQLAYLICIKSRTISCTTMSWYCASNKLLGTCQR